MASGYNTNVAKRNAYRLLMKIEITRKTRTKMDA
jgi:hypothetical protein